MQYLYADGELFNFMNQETYDQVALNKDIIGDALKFVKENEVCKVCSYNGNVFSVDPGNLGRAWQRTLRDCYLPSTGRDCPDAAGF